LTAARLELSDPVARLSFAFTQFLEKAVSDPIWARLVVQSAQAPTEFARGIRAHLKADLTDAIDQSRLSVQEVDLAADIVMGIWLQVVRSSLERRAAPDLSCQTLHAVLRALGASQPVIEVMPDRASRSTQGTT